jgi:uncharacterized protein YndB with AHSA1/START domain
VRGVKPSRTFGPLLAWSLLAVALPAAAAVVDSGPSGFLLRHAAKFAAPPARVWSALVEPARWWDPEHTWSGDAANLSLDPAPGGCFCEKLPDGGGVRHLTVVYAAPGSLLRLTGALGPLQQHGVAGSLTFQLEPAADGTTVTLTYSVGGYWPGGLATMAAPADGMLGAQFGRLKALVETGSATTK